MLMAIAVRTCWETGAAGRVTMTSIEPGLSATASPKDRCGHLQPLGGLSRVVLGSSHEITSRSFAGIGGQNMTECMKSCQDPLKTGKLDAHR